MTKIILSNNQMKVSSFTGNHISRHTEHPKVSRGDGVPFAVYQAAEPLLNTDGSPILNTDGEPLLNTGA